MENIFLLKHTMWKSSLIATEKCMNCWNWTFQTEVMAKTLSAVNHFTSRFNLPGFKLLTTITWLSHDCHMILMSCRYDPHRVVQQLRACGVLETVRISAAGYPSRWLYHDFHQRYRMLVPRGKRRKGETKQMVCYILQECIKVCCIKTYFLG